MLNLKIEKLQLQEMLDGKTTVKFCTKDIIAEGMRVNFFCDNGKSKVYTEGRINEILEVKLEKQSKIYRCSIHNDLILM